MRDRGICFAGRFPTFAVILLVFSVLWLLSDLGVITVRIPWLPIVLMVVATGWIMEFYSK